MEKVKEAAMIYRKRYMHKLIPYIDTPFIKILSGIRRCGKSTLLKMLSEELLQRGIEKDQILFYNFDSLQFEHIKTAQSLYAELKKTLIGGKRYYLFFDEIQEVESWEKLVNSLALDFDVDMYITGSNSNLLSSEIATYLTGRYISVKVYPLSFQEFINFKKEYAEINKLHDELVDYVQKGGFPAIRLKEYEQDEVYAIVKDIYNSTIFTDIVKRNEIRKVDQFERVVRFAFNNVGRTFSGASISKFFKSENRAIRVETIYNYLKQLENAFILQRCQRYDLEGKEILKTQEKFYLADPALRYSVLGYSSESVAAMLENIVYNELLSRDYEVYIGKLGQYEIDFIASRQGEKIYIQVSQMIGEKSTEEREYGRLLQIKDNYPKYVLRTDAFAGGNHEGIKTMHLADFLMLEEF